MFTVYEIGKMPINLLCGISIGAVIIVLSLFLGCFARNRRKNAIKITVLSILLILSTAVLTVSAVTSNDIYKSVVYAYYNGDYQTVEGKIEKIKYYNDTCLFTVGGLEFGEQGQNELIYPGFKGNDAYVHSEGQRVKVGYVAYDGYNIVVRLEIEAKDKK